MTREQRRLGRRLSTKPPAVWARTKQRAITAGTWQPPLVSASPARSHINQLHQLGMSYRQIAIAAGEDPSAIAILLTASPSRRISRHREQRILTIQMKLSAMDGAACVSSVGTCRRLQALSWAGWSPSWVAGKLNISREAVCSYQARPHVTVKTALAVKELFDAFAMNPGPSTRSATQAHRKGWVSALAWDEDNIDDPNARPCVDAPAGKAIDQLDPVLIQRSATGAVIDCSAPERDQLILEMAQQHTSAQQIATQLGISSRTVYRAKSRHRATERDRAA